MIWALIALIAICSSGLTKVSLESRKQGVELIATVAARTFNRCNPLSAPVGKGLVQGRSPFRRKRRTSQNHFFVSCLFVYANHTVGSLGMFGALLVAMLLHVHFRRHVSTFSRCHAHAKIVPRTDAEATQEMCNLHPRLCSFMSRTVGAGSAAHRSKQHVVGHIVSELLVMIHLRAFTLPHIPFLSFFSASPPIPFELPPCSCKLCPSRHVLPHLSGEGC